MKNIYSFVSNQIFFGVMTIILSIIIIINNEEVLFI